MILTVPHNKSDVRQKLLKTLAKDSMTSKIENLRKEYDIHKSDCIMFRYTEFKLMIEIALIPDEPIVPQDRRGSYQNYFENIEILQEHERNQGNIVIYECMQASFIIYLFINQTLLSATYTMTSGQLYIVHNCPKI